MYIDVTPCNWRNLTMSASLVISCPKLMPHTVQHRRTNAVTAAPACELSAHTTPGIVITKWRENLEAVEESRWRMCLFTGATL